MTTYEIAEVEAVRVKQRRGRAEEVPQITDYHGREASTMNFLSSERGSTFGQAASRGTFKGPVLRCEGQGERGGKLENSGCLPDWLELPTLPFPPPMPFVCDFVICAQSASACGGMLIFRPGRDGESHLLLGYPCATGFSS